MCACKEERERWKKGAFFFSFFFFLLFAFFLFRRRSITRDDDVARAKPKPLPCKVAASSSSSSSSSSSPISHPFFFFAQLSSFLALVVSFFPFLLATLISLFSRRCRGRSPPSSLFSTQCSSAFAARRKQQQKQEEEEEEEEERDVRARCCANCNAMRDVDNGRSCSSGNEDAPHSSEANDVVVVVFALLQHRVFHILLLQHCTALHCKLITAQML